MTINDIKYAMLNDGNMVCFSYNDRQCGLDIEGGIPSFRFQAWCGSDSKYYGDFDELVSDEFFDGRSLKSLLNIVEFSFI